MADKVLKLKKPYKFGDKEVTEVTFSQPKMKHLKGVDLANLTTDGINLIAGRVSNQPTAFFDELEWDDGFAVGEVIADFLPESLKTGKV